MKSKNQVIDPDVILIGSGIMSATLGAMLKELNPTLRIQLYEMTEEFGKEASNAWHNAGTGHAGLCELSLALTAYGGVTMTLKTSLVLDRRFP